MHVVIPLESRLMQALCRGSLAVMGEVVASAWCSTPTCSKLGLWCDDVTDQCSDRLGSMVIGFGLVELTV